MPQTGVPTSCTWPPLAEPYATALRQAVDYIFSRWSPAGIVASGTIVRGSPSPSSDLDLYVIHREPYRQRVQRTFNGVPAEVFVNPPHQIERQFESDRREGRLVAAHMLATGFVVFSGDQLIEDLRARAAAELESRPDPIRDALNRRRYAAATSLEDAEDIAHADAAVCALLLHRAVDAAISYRFWSARRWQPRAKDTLEALAEIDPLLAERVRSFYRGAELPAQRALAHDIVKQATGEAGFFEWESAPESV